MIAKYMTSKQKTLMQMLRGLLPEDEISGNQPFVYLVHLLWLLPPLLFEGVTVSHIMATLIAVACFLPIYFMCYWRHDLALLPWAAGLVLIGFVLAPYNFSASVFIIYACNFAANFEQLKNGLLYLASVLLLTAGYVWVQDITIIFLLSSVIFGLISGFANIHYRKVAITNLQLQQSKDEIQRLAQTAERERIARDLHDLMGHTFSMITVKAQLAKKLYQAGHDNIEQELSDIEALSRQALSEVRQTVDNYKLRGLGQELLQAQRLLEAAEFNFSIPDNVPRLAEALDSALAYAVRECVTNCVKYSNTPDCQIFLSHNNQSVHLTISNPGQYQAITEGNGLQGLKKRLDAVNGVIKISHSPVFEVDIMVDYTGSE